MAAVAIASGASAPASLPWSHHELATVLSPSQVQTFQDCASKWWFKYGMGLPDPKTSNLSLGIAVHDAIAANFRLKIDSGKDLPVDDVLQEFDAAWAEASIDTEFREDESPSTIAEAGRGLISLYMRDAAPKIQPGGVELEITGNIGGVQVQGKLDLIDQAGEIHELKTAAKKSSTISMNHTFQLATYAQLGPTPISRVHVDTLVKTKTPQLIQLTRTITAEDRRATETLYPLAQDSMRSGFYMPNRSSNLCSRKNCAFWRACEAEYGGHVAGGDE